MGLLNTNSSMSKYYLNYLDELESEAIYVLREVWAQFDNPVILFSGGKDSTCCLELAIMAARETDNLPVKVAMRDDEW